MVYGQSRNLRVYGVRVSWEPVGVQTAVLFCFEPLRALGTTELARLTDGSVSDCGSKLYSVALSDPCG